MRHPFLTACADGSISRSRFGRWIVQDHYFVVEFIRYAAHCLAKAPEEHFAVLLLGLESLRQEIIWFEVQGLVLHNHMCSWYYASLGQRGAHAPLAQRPASFCSSRGVLQVNGAQRGLDLMAPRSEAVKEYSRVLESYWDAPYPVHAAQLWAIEMAYNMGWRLPGPMRAPYNEFAERWGSDSFCKYVSALESQADKALESASPVSPTARPSP